MMAGQATIARSEIRLGMVCAALVVGEALGLSSGGVAAAWPVVGLAALLVAAFGFAQAWRFWHVAVFLLLGLMLAMREENVRHKALTEIEMRNGPYEDVFEVTGEPRVGAEAANGTRCVSFLTTFAGGKLNVIFHQPATNAAPRVGESWKCAGWLDRRKEGDRRIRRLWVKGHGSFAKRERAADPHSFVVLLARVKRDLSRRIGIGLEDRPVVADLNRAMVLGERAALPWEMRETFVKSGTIHVFAISGLHVMVVAEVFLYAIVLTMFPVRWAGVVLMPILWLYVLLIGAPPSAVRAAAMASVYYAAPIFWRRPDSLTAWEVTLIGFALLDPVGLFGVGSMLSFMVMLGILLFLRWAKPFMRPNSEAHGVPMRGHMLSNPVAWLGVPFAAWAAGVPIAAHVFSRITPGGLLANLAMVPMACGAVLTSVLGIVTSFISERLAAHVNNLAALFTEAMAGISWAVAKLPGADAEIQPWPLPICAAWYVGMILLFVWIRMVWKRRRSSLA